ncbi:Ger(x)C family spore germination protein [Peribacillus frigoritolerans]|uniref:Ger(x)C family spore germination protein n=1 Tax=Peribacillus frigoritolerans TaxID=450367 RepID=UPI0010594386|nr:Ger(x)C family spore germination protein [Peribacillus frigoritolerans]TDL79212.1 Ger(x)C family spore germination protein [Peribacillus frigoritolerans]
MAKVKAVILSCVLFLTGCTGVKNIQDLTYIVAIGMDFDEAENEYVVYLQGLNFANVAKQEGAKSVDPVPIFIATARGETMNLAVSKLYGKSEPPLYFGHVNTLLLTNRLIQSKSAEILEEVGRNRSLRPTMKVLTTEEKIEEVLNIPALFNYPAIYTVLFKEKLSQMAENELKAITMMDFLRDYYEPMGTAKIPSVKIDESSWKADKDYPVLYLNGFSAFQHQEYKKDIPLEHAVIINWLTEKGISIDQRVEKDGKLLAAVKLGEPKMKIKYDETAEMPKFSIEVSVSADLLEKIQQDLTLKSLKKQIEEAVKAKVEAVYYEGLDNKLDILNAGEKWYRKHPKQFQKLKENPAFYLDRESLTEVKVSAQILHFNSYKFKPSVEGEL